MIKPKAMSKVSVFGPKSYMKDVIGELYNMNVVHIEDFTRKSEKDIFDIGEPFEKNEQLAETLIKVRTIISNLKIKKSSIEPSTMQLDDISKKTEGIHEKTSKLLAKKEYYEQIIRIYEQKQVEKALSLLKIEGDHKHYVGFVDSDELKPFDDVTNVNFEGITLAAIFTDSKDALDVLESYDFSPIDNPVVKKVLKLKSPSGVKFVKLNNQAHIIGKKLEKVNGELDLLKKEHDEFLISAENRLIIETDKAEAPLRFATTKNTFLIKGWVPKENVEKLKDSLNSITKNRVMLKFDEPTKKDNVPIAFKHPKIVEPFEAFMNLYTLPSYKEIDPTFFMFLTFPFFFGFMLGDVGYGMVTLLLFATLKKKMPGARNMLNAFMIASIASIAFGMVFGEYFGYEEVSPTLGKILGIHPETLELHGETETIYPIPHLFARSHGIEDLLSMAVLFGIIHIMIGLIIGFVNVYNEHGIKHAILEKGGWLLLLPGMIWLLANFLGVITGFVRDLISPLILPLPVIGVLSFAAVVLVIAGEGARGAVELPALLSNILSYARLMAVGLASLSLALVVNNLAGQMFSAGAVGIFAGILILIVGHTINIALGILSPFLHSLRLHYVEFFTKFFHGGGKKYKTFGYGG